MKIFRLTIQNSVFLQLFIIALLIVINFFVVQSFDSSLSEVEKTVDLAESNGTYSQQIPLFARFIAEGQEQYRVRLTEAVEQFSDNLRTLRQGGASPEDKNSIIEEVPKALLPAYFQPLELFWNEYRDQARRLTRESIQLPNGKPNPRFETAFQFLLQNHAKLLRRNDNLVKAYLDYFDKQQTFRDNIFLGFFSVNIVSIVVMFFYVIGYVSRPISKLNDIEAIIREGNFERQIDYRRNDELGKVANSINSLFRNLRNATDFILDIGEGKLNSEYQRPVGIDAQNDRLGTALMEMRDKMRQVNEQDRQRNWVSEGLAKFADIFQNRKDDEDFTYIIISNLVRYVGANQGGLFIVEDEKNEDSHLELIAAFAYEKRKYMQKRIDPGEGLIGEVYREGSLIYMTEVPEDYVHITSGLGDARPRSLLLVPLKLNEEIYGVVELASFEEFEPYKIDFVEKLGESIASTFASVKNSKKTEGLLRESIQLSEQMKAQEEEMRQNLEELVATQEEVQLKNRLIQEQKSEIEQLLEDEKRRTRDLEERYKSLQIQYEALQKTLRGVENENRILQEEKSGLERVLAKESKNV
ncbi:MAG: hypothetical protein OHK0053_20450 [Microscillaceae bacterium]